MKMPGKTFAAAAIAESGIGPRAARDRTSASLRNLRVSGRDGAEMS
jgi:hypothetical protein